ncbi:MAG TPA: RdgB/HAM1 family non-canonical purine NTP pyrophosphatase [Acidimicrobiales bacterium]|nr:RdgB/HAM1 family non-canonical purine NTP pyrophosphatase [Acidimicrobiales bacterium]
MKFVLASANPDKAREMRQVLEEIGFELVERPSDVPDVEENGRTLEDNARLKAQALADATGLPAIADDTGLEVDALGRAPGVRSARYAGEGATYADNVEKLLDEMERHKDRKARFRSVTIARWPDGREVIAEGLVMGRIAAEPAGEGGFGYDPVFVPDLGGGRTFAEMEPSEKHLISHRGRSLRALAEQLSKLDLTSP